MPLVTLHNDLNDYLSTLKAKVSANFSCMRACPLEDDYSMLSVLKPVIALICYTCLPAWAKLVEVINEDYGEYVSLSSRLVNVEGFVLRMRKPLVELYV